MPWILQMAGLALFLIGIGIALWVSLWLLVFFFSIGVIAVVWSSLRDYLLAKGILNPTPGVPPKPGDDVEVTIVEGSFTRVETRSANHEAAPNQE